MCNILHLFIWLLGSPMLACQARHGFTSVLGCILYLLQWLLLLFPTPQKISQPKAFMIKPSILGGKSNQQGLFWGEGQLGVVTILGYNPKCLNLNGGAMYLVALCNYLVFLMLPCSARPRITSTSSNCIVIISNNEFSIVAYPSKKSHDSGQSSHVQTMFILKKIHNVHDMPKNNISSTFFSCSDLTKV